MLRHVFILLLTALLFAVFCALGVWQLERRTWKLDLIAQVERQLAQSPTPAPGAEQWPSLGADDTYRPVKISGHYLHDQATLVQAMTRLGSGYWVITPLQTNAGFAVLVNRGFVDQPHRQDYSRPAGTVTISGLLRLTEPGGRVLRPNVPAEDRWYSRDVAAIAQKRGLSGAALAPYFIDADRQSETAEWPAGGLTVVKFRNTHLSYALTWFALASLSLLAGGIVLRKRPSGG